MLRSFSLWHSTPRKVVCKSSRLNSSDSNNHHFLWLRWCTPHAIACVSLPLQHLVNRVLVLFPSGSPVFKSSVFKSSAFNSSVFPCQFFCYSSLFGNRQLSVGLSNSTSSWSGRHSLERSDSFELYLHFCSSLGDPVSCIWLAVICLRFLINASR